MRNQRVTLFPDESLPCLPRSSCCNPSCQQLKASKNIPFFITILFCLYFICRKRGVLLHFFIDNFCDQFYMEFSDSLELNFQLLACSEYLLFCFLPGSRINLAISARETVQIFFLACLKILLFLPLRGLLCGIKYPHNCPV